MKAEERQDERQERKKDKMKGKYGETKKERRMFHVKPEGWRVRGFLDGKQVDMYITPLRKQDEDGR